MSLIREPRHAQDDRPAMAARLAPRLRALADRGVYFETSSWKYEGWLGSIYGPDRYLTRGKHSTAKFERECLAEHARTFPTVCGDFAFYQFPGDDYWRGLFGQLPAGFVMGLKVPEDITVTTWPTHMRYGVRAGVGNEHFLDPKPFARYFAKRLEPYGERVGPLILEFGTVNNTTFPAPADFSARLDPFLAALPNGFRYAVEIRNADYLTPAYFDALARHNVAHCFNAWTRMPTLEDQASLPDAWTADFTVVRALLARGRACEKAVEAFQPYDRIRDPNERAREAMAEIAGGAVDRTYKAYFFVNNRLEGFAPATIEAVVGLVLPGF
jgi:uncharacterized protein YecE (DUF72 family)